MGTLKQYTLVAQSRSGRRHAVQRWDGKDLSGILGITQAPRMGPATYGWIQVRGEARVQGCQSPVFVDFTPNDAKLQLSGRPTVTNDRAQQQARELERFRRLAKLHPLLIEEGEYCKLLIEARDTFVDGHFYACVAMCGITFERFQRDKARPYGAKSRAQMPEIREILSRVKVLEKESLQFCKDMATMRNAYAHGRGQNPKRDALKALTWLHKLIEKETSLMRNYQIRHGALFRTSDQSSAKHGK